MPAGIQRFTVPDPQVNSALQGIQNMLNQLQQQINAPVGPGAGVYLICPAITTGGKPGTVTLNALGQVVSTQQAT